MFLKIRTKDVRIVEKEFTTVAKQEKYILEGVMRMDLDNKIMQAIIEITENTTKVLYASEQDKAIRKYAIDNMFDCLEKAGQDEVIKYMFSLLVAQNNIKIEMK